MKFTENHKRKIGLANKGKKRSDEFRKRMSEIGRSRVGNKNSFFGKKHSEETKRKISLKQKGKSPWQKRLGDNHPKVIEYRKKMKELGGIQNIGRNPWNYGLTKEDPRVMKYTTYLYGNKFGKVNKGMRSPWTLKRNLENNPMKNEEIRIKVGKKLKGMFALEKNPMWKGGLSFEPYTIDWTNELRKFIRDRDNHTCQLCLNKGNQVHHIDYNKKNCDINNLITLCKKCHSKTNKDREKWKKFFSERIKP
jgi:hypothetical protein